MGKGKTRFMKREKFGKQKPVKSTRLRNNKEISNEVTFGAKVLGVSLYILSFILLIVVCVILGVFG